MLNLKLKGRNRKPEGISLILLLFALGVLSLIICSVISSAVVYSLKDPQRAIGLGGLASIILAGGVSGLFASYFTKGEIRQCAIPLGAVAAILFLIPLFFSGSAGGGIMNALCYFGTAVILCPVFKKKRHKRR